MRCGGKGGRGRGEGGVEGVGGGMGMGWWGLEFDAWGIKSLKNKNLRRLIRVIRRGSKKGRWGGNGRSARTREFHGGEAKALRGDQTRGGGNRGAAKKTISVDGTRIGKAA